MPLVMGFFFCWALGSHLHGLSRPLMKAGLLQALFLTPAWTLVYLASPSYALLYCFDPVDYPVLARAGAVTLAINLASFGVLATAQAAAQALRRSGVLLRVLFSVTPGAAALGFGLFFSERLMYFGNYEAFWLREAPFIGRVPMLWAVWGLFALAALTPAWMKQRMASCRVPKAAGLEA